MVDEAVPLRVFCVAMEKPDLFEVARVSEVFLRQEFDQSDFVGVISLVYEQ
jgi:hypothetical protein